MKYNSKMKELSILFCLLAIISVSSTLKVQHKTMFGIGQLPGHSELLANVGTLTIEEDQLVYNGCNFNVADLNHFSEGTVSVDHWHTSKMECPGDDENDRQIRGILSKTHKIEYHGNRVTFYNINNKNFLNNIVSVDCHNSIKQLN